MDDKQQIEDLIIAFFRSLDARDDDGAAAAFASHGIWHRQGAILRGPEDIVRILAARPAERRSAHIVTNIAVTTSEGGGCVARYYLTGYVASGDGPLVPSAILDCCDEIERIDGRPRIVRKTSTVIGTFG